MLAFYGLCRDVAELAGIDIPPEPEPSEEGAYYSRLAAIFAEHSTSMEGRWDALIVDEGQDVSADWWDPLQLMLPDPTAARSMSSSTTTRSSSPSRRACQYSTRLSSSP